MVACRPSLVELMRGLPLFVAETSANPSSLQRCLGGPVTIPRLAHTVAAHKVPAWTALLGLALFTLGGYGCLTLYDALAVRFAGARVPYPRVALISFMGYAIGHNVGLNTLSGGAIRYRAYTALGLGAKQIATIIAFGSVTFLLGAGLLLGLSLVTQAGMSVSALHVHASL